IVLSDERHFSPEARVCATPSLSTRQSPETPIRWWPELDRVLVARRPPPQPNPRFMLRNDPSRGAGRNGEPPPTHQCQCRSSPPRRLALADWIRHIFFPFSRRRWKPSTASTTGDRIRKHILTDLGTLEMPSITRDRLQQYLEQKAAQGH